MKKRRRKLVLVALLSAALIGSNISPVYAEEEQKSSESSESSSSSSESKSESGSQSSESKSGSSSSSSESKSESSSSSSESKSESSSSSSDSKSESSSSSSESKSEGSGSSSESKSESGSQPSDSKLESGSQSSENKSEGSASSQESEPENGASSVEDPAGNTQDTDTSGSDTVKEDGAETESGGETAADPDEKTEDADGTQAAPDGTQGEEGETLNGEEAQDGELTDAEAAPDGTLTEEEQHFTNKAGEDITPSELVGTDYDSIAENYDGEENVLKQYVDSEEYAPNTIVDSYVDENGNLILLISKGAEPEPIALDEGLGLEAEKGSSSDAPAVDGSFSGWDDIPESWEYNWDNSGNCWQWGVWYDEDGDGNPEKHMTDEGTYDNNVRHKMQLYTDGENVYLRIVYAGEYGASGSYGNGDDFNFYVDDTYAAKFGITWPDGSTITGPTPGAGVYQVDVRNGDKSNSYSIVDGASAYYYVTENGLNNQLELKIPLEALAAQAAQAGVEIDWEHFNLLEFFTPNLMYRRLATGGASTGAAPFAVAVFLLVPASYVWLRKKSREEVPVA